jgi:hypothetical protein
LCLFSWLVLLGLTGCGKTADRVKAVAISSGAASRAAIAENDTDGDGAISGVELDKAPAFQSAIRRLDTDGDGKITADEIAARIDRWNESKVACMPLVCTVTFKGRPLEGAVVTLVPESCLGESLHPATGTTDSYGTAALSVGKEFLPNPALSGVQCGLFKVTITHPQKKIPAEYNTHTTLGCEIALDSDCVRNGLQYNL